MNITQACLSRMPASAPEITAELELPPRQIHNLLWHLAEGEGRDGIETYART